MLGLISKRKVLDLLNALFRTYDDLYKLAEKVNDEECRQRALHQRGAIYEAIEEIKKLA